MTEPNVSLSHLRDMNFLLYEARSQDLSSSRETRCQHLGSAADCLVTLQRPLTHCLHDDHNKHSPTADSLPLPSTLGSRTVPCQEDQQRLISFLNTLHCLVSEGMQLPADRLWTAPIVCSVIHSGYLDGKPIAQPEMDSGRRWEGGGARRDRTGRTNRWLIIQ